MFRPSSDRAVGEPADAPAPPRLAMLRLLGPAFVAAVAYIDPGNYATNIQAGARYGYLLLWVHALIALRVLPTQGAINAALKGIVTQPSRDRNQTVLRRP